MNHTEENSEGKLLLEDKIKEYSCNELMNSDANLKRLLEATPTNRKLAFLLHCFIVYGKNVSIAKTIQEMAESLKVLTVENAYRS